jgi:hypothetical protein
MLLGIVTGFFYLVLEIGDIAVLYGDLNGTIYDELHTIFGCYIYLFFSVVIS